RRGEQHVAEHAKIRPLAAVLLRVEQLGWPVELVIVELGAGRQHAFIVGDWPRLHRHNGKGRRRKSGDRNTEDFPGDAVHRGRAQSSSSSLVVLSFSFGAACCISAASSSPPTCTFFWSRSLMSLTATSCCS